MSSHDVEQCIKTYLREHDGSAPAGEVTAHAIAAGHAASTVRRVADRIVRKDRTGNTFAWSLKPKPVYAPSPARPDAEISSRVGRMIDTRKKLSLWDAQRFNGEPYDSRQDQPAPARVPQRDPASVAEPETVDHDDLPDSPYARMSQSELMHLIRTRPTLAPWAEKPITYTAALTEIEAICLLDMDDAGEIHLPGINTTATGARAPF